MVFADFAAVGAADVAHGAGHGGAFGVAVPAHAVLGVGAPLEHLVFAAVGAWHLEHAAVTGVVGGFDAADVFGGGRAGAQVLSAGEGGLTGAGELHGVALPVHIHGVGVLLVREEVAHRHGAQAGGAVGAGNRQEAAGKFFQEGGVGFVAAAVFAHGAAQDGAFLDHGHEALAAVALGHVDGGLHDHDGARVDVGEVADPVAADGGFAGLRAPHEDDLLNGAAGTQAVHGLAGVGGAVDAVGARLCAVFARQDAVALGPLGDGERWRRGEVVAPDTGQQGFGVHEVEITRAHAGWPP